MLRLETVTTDDFAPHQGTTFHLHLDAGEFPLTLTEITGQGSGTGRPFSVLFSGPPQPALPQQIYALSHAALGEMEIFLVPVSGNAQQRCYEAVFA